MTAPLPVRSQDSPERISAAAIRFLAERGYESTTAGELADAVGLSRSTFFRRFGSKDDAIFVDHDEALQRLTTDLDGTAQAWQSGTLRESHRSIAEVMSRTVSAVFHQLTRDPEAAVLRSELLRTTPALRDRELVLTHRYERVFVEFIQRVAPQSTPAWVPHAVAAGAVAVHNATLRSWLRAQDSRIVVTLDADLRALIQRFALWLRPEDTRQRVLVATFDPATPATSLLEEIRVALAADPGNTETDSGDARPPQGRHQH